MKKQIKKIGLLFSLALVAFVSFGLSSVKATDNKILNVSKEIYDTVTYVYEDSYGRGGITKTNLTVEEAKTIKSLSNESTHTLVIPTELFEKLKVLKMVAGFDFSSLRDESWDNYTWSQKDDKSKITISKDMLSGIEKFTNLEEFVL